MDKQTAKYRSLQFRRAKYSPEYTTRIKVSTEFGETNWLSITEKELKLIRKMLLSPLKS